MLNNLYVLKTWAENKISRFIRDERGEVNIVAMVVLIGIAVVLAIIFKEAIVGLINNLLNQIQGSANNAIQKTN